MERRGTLARHQRSNLWNNRSEFLSLAESNGDARSNLSGDEAEERPGCGRGSYGGSQTLILAALFQTGIHFDGTITLGSILSAVCFLFLAAVAWRDLNWRIKNLENWRKEHMVDADSRDELVRNSQLMLQHLKTLVERRGGNRQ